VESLADRLIVRKSEGIGDGTLAISDPLFDSIRLTDQAERNPLNSRPFRRLCQFPPFLAFSTRSNRAGSSLTGVFGFFDEFDGAMGASGGNSGSPLGVDPA
jgi:hypothetical protein